MAENPVVIKKEEGSVVMPLPSKAVAMRVGLGIGGVAVLAAAAPFVGTAVAAGAGLLALGAFALVGVAVVMALPLIGQKYENRLLAARKAEARANPEEELDKRVLYKRAKYKEAKDALKVIAGYVRGLARMIAQEKKEDPDHDVSHLEKSLTAMIAFVSSRVERMKQAEKKLADFEKAVKRWKFEHRFTEKGNVAVQSIQAMEGNDDFTGELMTEEAILSIEEGFDTLFGEMDIEVMLSQASHLQKTSPQLIDIDDSWQLGEAITPQFEEARR